MKSNNDCVSKILCYGYDMYNIKSVVGDRISVVDDRGYSWVFIKSDLGVDIIDNV
jgi:hypothetical protein